MASPPSLPSVPTIELPPTKVWITKASQAPDPDRTIRIAHAVIYPIHLWYFFASFIFLLTVINYTRRVTNYYHARAQRRRLTQAPNDGTSAQGHPTRGPINLWRLPRALGDTLRALSFRWTVPIGQSYTLNLAEVVLSAMHMAACLTWSLINSEL